MNPIYPQASLDSLNELRKSNTLTDVTLIAESRRFPAHKSYLVAVSDFFARAFLGSFREASRNELVLQETPEVLRLILDAIYGQWRPSGDFRLDFPIAKKLIYYQVKGFDPDYLVLNAKIDPQDFAEYLRDVAGLYEEGISEEVIDRLSSMIGPETDLSEFSDETITALLLSPGYNPKNVLEIYDMISGLIPKGHSMGLAALINYNLFPDDFLKRLPQDFLQAYNLGGPLPRLGKIPERIGTEGAVVSLVVNNYYTDTSSSIPRNLVSLIDSTGQRHIGARMAMALPQITIGDIVTRTIYQDRDRIYWPIIEFDIDV